MATESKRERNIVNRLTNPALYTGTHRERFDESGKGRGKEGRTDTIVKDLSDLTRPNLHATNPKRSTGTSGIDLSNVQKFGTQAKKAPVIKVYTNGDVNSKGVDVTLGKALPTWEKLMEKLTKELKISTGQCKKLYEVVRDEGGNTHKRVTKLEELQDGGVYLGCGPEEIKGEKYPKELGACK